jgi:hypothetical protein
MSLKCKDNKALSKELELQNIPNTYEFDKTLTWVHSFMDLSVFVWIWMLQVQGYKILFSSTRNGTMATGL